MSKLDELIRELCPDGVEYKKLGEIATVLRGASPRPIKKYITNDSDGVNWIKIGDVPVGSKYITQSEEKITKEGAEKSRYVQKGDFILSNSMSFGRPYILAIDGCIHDGWLSISNFKDVFLSDYLYYLLSSSAIQQEMKKRAIDMEISVNLIRYRHCEWGASCKCHWETGKAKRMRRS